MEGKEGMLFEKQIIYYCMEKLDTLFINNPVQCIQKNAKDSIQYRKQGNAIYLSKDHNVDKHQNTWNLYTKSVAAAPNDSEELALAYGNRSALLFHLKEYEECIKDCDRGFKITSFDCLKTKLLLRKIESLVALEKETAKTTCKEALQSFAQFKLNADVKVKFVERLNHICNNISIETFKEKEVEKKEVKLPTFMRQNEAPCASTAVSIKYNEKYGRHIVATRTIEPGEILVVEKSYLTTICHEGMYLFCANCVHQTWASIPCEGCIYNVYCLAKCKSEAWNKYHKFECSVLSHLYNINLDVYFPSITSCEASDVNALLKSLVSALKFVLITVDEVGCVNKLRRELISIENCKDPRTKGFSDDGVLQSDKCRSIYSLTTVLDKMHKDNLGIFVSMACIGVYYLARETTFFGKKIKVTPKEMILNEDIKLVGALILKSLLSLPNNTLKYFVHRGNPEVVQSYGFAIYPFSCLFNHSCDPNVKCISTNTNETIVYAKHLIKKGEQLFLCYVGNNFVSSSKAERLRQLMGTYRFECKCIACKKNSPSYLPFVKDIISKSPSLKYNITHKYKYIETLHNDVMLKLENSNYEYDPLIMNDVKTLMKKHAKHITVYSMDYEIFEHFIYIMLAKEFGTWLNIPDTC